MENMEIVRIYLQNYFYYVLLPTFNIYTCVINAGWMQIMYTKILCFCYAYLTRILYAFDTQSSIPPV